MSGAYVVFTHGSALGPVGDVSIMLNALLIMLFAAIAWRKALERKFKQHAEWMLRLFLAMSGVWFFRVGLMLWLLIHGKAVGFDPDTFRGPFLTFLGFGQYTIPLMVLELYFWARKSPQPAPKWIIAGSLMTITILMGLGIFAATMGMWFPRL